jgi:SAM-dependent methyltransferase
MNQDQIFRASEADQWFQRNGQLLKANWQTDGILRLLRLYDVRPRRVVEVGASNGYRVAAIQEELGCEAVAVEPSASAVEDGRSRYPRVRFCQGTAAGMDLGETFDLVIVNGVFAWIDRTTLLQSVADIDRLVAPGGLLAIGDFLPPGPRRVRYHHRPDQLIYTYKQDYAAIFRASALYQSLAMLSSDHSTRDLAVIEDSSSRWGTYLLRKSLHEHYVEDAMPNHRGGSE